MITIQHLATWTEEQDMGFTNAMDLTKDQLAKLIADGASMESIVQYAHQIAEYEGRLQVLHRIDIMIIATATVEKIVGHLLDMVCSDYADPRDTIGQKRIEGKRQMVRKVNELVTYDMK